MATVTFLVSRPRIPIRFAKLAPKRAT